MSCDISKATEGLENELWRRWSNGKVGEWAPTFPLLHLRHSWFPNPSVALTRPQLILQPFSLLQLPQSSFSNPSFASPRSQDIHSTTFPSLHLHHSSFSNPSIASPTSQLILQTFRCLTYVIAHSPTLPLPQLRHSSFSNPSFASPMSQDLHLPHLGSHPCTQNPR